jgi:hypothetical protein
VAIGVSTIAQTHFLSVGPKPPKAGDVFGFNRCDYANNNRCATPTLMGCMRAAATAQPHARKSTVREYRCAARWATSIRNRALTPSRARYQRTSAPWAMATASRWPPAASVRTSSPESTAQLDDGPSQTSGLSPHDVKTIQPEDEFSEADQRFRSGSRSPLRATSARLPEPAIGYPTDRSTQHTTENERYRTEIGVAQELGVSNDLYAPGASARDINARINGAANTSTQYFCQTNGC